MNYSELTSCYSNNESGGFEDSHIAWLGTIMTTYHGKEDAQRSVGRLGKLQLITAFSTV